MNRLLTLVIAGVAAAASFPTAARSEEPPPRQRYLTAPFTSDAGSATCTNIADPTGNDLTATCPSSSATADADTGAFALDLETTSPHGGTLPGAAVNAGSASITTTDTVPASVPALLYVASLRIDDLDAETRSGIAPFSPAAPLTARLDVKSAACECTASAAHDLVDTDAGTTLLLPAVLTNPSKGVIPAGDVTVTLTLASSRTLIGIGSLETKVHATLTQIESARPSLERDVLPPYHSASANRVCQGSLGTTFACRASAASTTGRVEFNLGVLSPVAGTVPGSGTANGDTGISVDVSPNTPIRAAAYVVTLHLADAEAFTAVTSPLVGEAAATLDATASLQNTLCDVVCSNSRSASIVDATDLDSRLDDDVSFVLWALTPDAAPGIPAAYAALDLHGSASLQNASGQALAMLSGAVASVRVIEIA